MTTRYSMLQKYYVDFDAEPGDLMWVQIIHANEHDVWGVRVEDYKVEERLNQ